MNKILKLKWIVPEIRKVQWFLSHCLKVVIKLF